MQNLIKCQNEKIYSENTVYYENLEINIASQMRFKDVKVYILKDKLLIIFLLNS